MNAEPVTLPRLVRTATTRPSSGRIRSQVLGAPVLSSLLLVALFVAVEFGWKYAAPLNRFKWQVVGPLWVVAVLVVMLSRRLWPLGRSWPMGCFLAWLAWNEVAVLWADEIATSQMLTLSLMATSLVGVWFASAYGWHSFSAVIAATGAAFEALSLLAHALHYPAGVHGRMIGIGWGYSDTGIVAAFTTVIAFDRYRHRPWLRGIVLTLGLTTLVFAQARMSLVATVVGLAVVAIQRWRRQHAILLGAALVIGLGFGAVLVVGDSVLSSSISRTGQVQDASSFTGRSLVWGSAFDQIARTPWLGIGSKDNEGFFVQASARGDIQIPIFHAHNALLETTLETGLIGGGLFLLALAGFASQVVRRRALRNPGRDACVAVFVFLGVTEALLAQGTLAVLVLSAALASSAAHETDVGTQSRAHGGRLHA
jgi:O-antigen ligase